MTTDQTDHEQRHRAETSHPTGLVHATFRVHELDRTADDITMLPVRVGHSENGNVLMALAPDAAMALAQIIGRHSALGEQASTHPEIDPALWDHAVVDLFIAETMCKPAPHVGQPLTVLQLVCQSCGLGAVRREADRLHCDNCGLLAGAPS